MIKRALLSVSDKTGLVEFARFLVSQNVELLSTGGTAELLRSHGLTVRDVSDVTHFPEMMDGRVKTLHPAIHGGLLARRTDDAHMAAASTHHIPMIDLLVVNLYPFETTLNATRDYDTLVENIDIGGPAMIRAAAKNHESVTVLVDVADYEMLQQTMQQNANAIPTDIRRSLAAKAFARCASYDTLISSWLTSASPIPNPQSPIPSFPAYLLDAALAQTLRYGENPHQAAALYSRLDAKGGIAHAQQLQGKPLSYNNLADADAAWQIVSSYTHDGENRIGGTINYRAPNSEGAKPPSIATLIKHANPCGTAIGHTLVEAFNKALACDPVSAFGGILAVNQPVNASLVDATHSLFLEVIIAPEFTPEAREKLAAKKNLRLLVAAPENHASPLADWMIAPISGGYLVQSKDSEKPSSEGWVLATTAPLTTHHSSLTDSILAWHVVKSVKSNAIVLVKNGATIGIGAGQMSRVDSVRIAIEKAKQHGHDPRGATLASDAFFPFADNVELAAEAGITTLIQPGGSVRDAEVIDAANTHGITMFMTGLRHFKH